MCGQHQNLPVEGRNDEVNPLRRNALDALLNHMVAVLVTDASHHMTVKLGNELGLLIYIHHLQRLQERIQDRGTSASQICT